MRLTIEEFNRIRPLQWRIRQIGQRAYNTPVDQTETRLFWLDFMRLVFAPKFKSQFGITQITDFDTTQPVLLTNELEITLPPQIETAMYFANNKTLPIQFKFDMSQSTIVVIAIIILILILLFDLIYGSHMKVRYLI